MKTIEDKYRHLKVMITMMLLSIGLMMNIACGNDDDITIEPPSAASVQIVSGEDQSGFINATLGQPIEIEILDQNGDAFPGAAISVSVAEGSPSSSTLITGASGRTSVDWTLGETIGAQQLTLTAFSNDGTPLIGSPAIVMAEGLDLCQTFSNTEQLPIGPDAGTLTTSIITITDEFTVTDQTIVTLNLEHTFCQDLSIFLVAPNNMIVTLSFRNGGSGNNYTNTIFDDQASALITDGIPPFTGRFRPETPLTSLEGIQAFGDWKLLIYDNVIADGGMLLDWSIQLCRP